MQIEETENEAGTANAAESTTEGEATAPLVLESVSEPAPPLEAEPGTLADFLDRLTSRVSVDRIEEIWVFPPRKAGFGDSIVLAVSAFEEDPERRRIVTARFSVTKDPKGRPIVEEAIDEQGTAPADRVSRVIEGVLRRMGDDLTAIPRHVPINGDLNAWHRLRDGQS